MGGLDASKTKSSQKVNMSEASTAIPMEIETEIQTKLQPLRQEVESTNTISKSVVSSNEKLMKFLTDQKIKSGKKAPNNRYPEKLIILSAVVVAAGVMVYFQNNPTAAVQSKLIPKTEPAMTTKPMDDLEEDDLGI